MFFFQDSSGADADADAAAGVGKDSHDKTSHKPW